MPSTKKLKRRIRLLTATVEQLLIDNAAYATRLAEEGRGKQLAEVRAREAQNRLDAVRARVAQADRAALLNRDGAGWPEEVVRAAQTAIYGPFEDGFMRFKTMQVLDAAARANRDVTERDKVARALEVIGEGHAFCERLLSGAGHDAVGTTADGAA